MGDPFSVAGTAVGITSLGIQLCQILSRYYSQYRGIHDEINDVVDRADALEAYLKSLAKVKQKIETDDIALSAELQKALKACEDVLARLKEMAKRCGETKAPDSFADRMRMAQKRLLWPFKRDTLMDLQTTLDRFQSNLGLALQLLGLDYEADQLKTLVAETREMHKEVNNISTAQVVQATQLNTSISNLSSQLALTQITALDGFDAVSAAQKSHTALVEAGYEGLSNQYEHLLKQSTAIQQILEQLVPAASTSHPTGTLRLPNIVTNEQAAKTLKASFNRSLRQYNANIPRNQNRNVSELMGCICRSAATEKMSTPVGRWIAFYSESAYEHTPGCPYFSHSDFSKNVGLRFTMCNFLIRKCVHAGFQQLKVQGWSTISPFLRYRAVVPHNSGIFKVLTDAQRAATKLGDISNISHQKEAEDILPELTNSMKHCFSTNGHPTDIDEFGTGILEEIMWILWRLIVECRMENQAIISNFLDACRASGVFCNDADDEAVLVWTYLATNSSTDLTFEIFRRLARGLRTWELSYSFNPGPGTTKLYYTVSKILMTEELSIGFLENDSLHGALLRRSEIDFQSCIRTSSPEYLKSVLSNFEYIGPLVSWKTGLEILISSGSADGFPQLLTSLWALAAANYNVESLQVLVDSHWETSLEDWFILNIWTSQIYQRKYDNFAYWSDPKRYRPIFKSLATKLSRQLELDYGTKLRSENSLPYRKEIPFYHTQFLHVTTAEDLWNAGYRFIDTTHPEAHKKRSNETPLWMIASGTYIHGERNLHWPVVSWLIEKGANAFWSHPVLLTTPAHILVRLAVRIAIVHHALEGLRSTLGLLLSLKTDRCSCYCSLSGCYAVSCAVSKSALEPQRELLKKNNGLQQEISWEKKILLWLFSILDEKSISKELGLAVIRLLTFDELPLTHTCCYRINRYSTSMEYYTPLGKHEIEEIHTFEEEEIVLLEGLMKGFKTGWYSHNSTFTSFLEHVWKPRIEIFRAKQKDLHKIYQETGIKLSVSKPDLGELGIWGILYGSEVEEQFDDNSNVNSE